MTSASLNIWRARRTIQLFTLISLFCVDVLHAQWVYTSAIGGPINALAAGRTALFAGTWLGGVFRSTDNGASWVAVNTGLSNGIVLTFAISGDNLFAGTYGGGIFRSTNEGESWTAANVGLTSFYINTIVISDTNIFVGTGGGGIFRSTDKGESWAAVDSGLTDLNVLSLACSETLLFAGTASGGIFRSTNKGTAWVTINTGLSNAAVKVVAASGKNLIAGTDGNGIFLSTDSGTNWSGVSDGLSMLNVRSLFVSGTNLLVTAEIRHRGGVFHSANDCAIWWRAFSTGLPNDPVNAITILNSNIFVGTINNGVWRRPISDMDTSRTFPTYRRGILKGITYVDENWNGILDSNEHPLARLFIDLSGKQAGTTMSDCDGEFSFAGLDSGSYTLNVSQRIFPWYVVSPPSGNYSLTRRVNDSSGYFPFGIFLADGLISGKIFADENSNGVQDVNEAPLSRWGVTLSGRGQAATLSDSNGEFTFRNLPPGTYSVTEGPQLPWMVSSPSTGSYSVTLGLNDTSTNNVFGNTYPWSSISGEVFWDRNENGIRDSTENPLSNWLVKLSGDTHDSVLTDSVGNYLFLRVDRGLHVVYPSTPPPWENNPVTHGAGDSIIYNDYDQHRTNLNFALHRIPKRVRLKLTVHDNTQYLRQDIFCGIRPGATAGIWGADGHATNTDFSEGESELPPRDFAEFLGLFDARFVDPGNVGGYFGEGSWTDMRNFYWSDQTDHYKIAVLPGYRSGGNYPITLRWSKDSVRSCYAGAVMIDDQHGAVLDMKTMDSLVVTNEDIHYLLLAARQPKLPSRDAVHWELLSSPVDLPVSSLTTARSPLYSYSPGAGYMIRDSLFAGIGYWLKYSRGIDTLSHSNPTRQSDTLTLSAGWNLIGALGAPLDVHSVLTVPADIIGRNFFYHDGSYLLADSLRPEYGYWVKAQQGGQLILGSPEARQVGKVDPLPSLMRTANTLRFTDASGNAGSLYFTVADGKTPADSYELPPQGPAGFFDVRFGTGRMLEFVRPGESVRIPIRLAPSDYPVTIRWELKTHTLSASLFIDKKEIQLRGDGGMEITSEVSSLSLALSGSHDLPKAFLLEQNYPNPFNPTTRLEYDLPTGAYVRLSIYNVLGQIVATVVDEYQQAGWKSIEYNAENLPTGIYFYRLQADRFTAIKKMILVK